MSLNRFVFYGEWLDNIKDLPLDVQDKIIAEIVRYGTDMERQYIDDAMVSMAVNFTKGAIDNSKNEYLKKIEAGNNYGRKKVASDEEIHALAIQGKKSGEIADILGIGKSTVDHSEGWKQRKDKEFKF